MLFLKCASEIKTTLPLKMHHLSSINKNQSALPTANRPPQTDNFVEQDHFAVLEIQHFDDEIRSGSNINMSVKQRVVKVVKVKPVKTSVGKLT